MIAATDVQYFEEGARAACVCFHEWSDSAPAEEYTAWCTDIAPYEPGAFYKRELPCLLEVLTPLLPRLSLIIVDGYVWLGDENTPGLGARLYQALEGKIPVVGVAKTRFAGAAPVAEVLRGESKTPLYISTVGCNIDAISEYIIAMNGLYRLPELLKYVDKLARLP